MDVAVPSDYNILKKTTERISKFVDPQIKWQKMLNENVGVVPVIGSSGLVEKNLKNYIRRIPGQHNIYYQRSAIIGTVKLLRKVLSIKPY